MSERRHPKFTDITHSLRASTAFVPPNMSMTADRTEPQLFNVRAIGPDAGMQSA